METNKTTLLITDTDLDGIGCAVLMNIVKYGSEIQFYRTGVVDEYIRSLIDSGDIDKYDTIYMTDISVNEETADILNRYYENGVNIKLIDHHKTALWMNKYEWADVTVEYPDGRLTSGTSLFMDFLSNNYSDVFYSNMLKKELSKILRFVELVRLWDTFEWKTSNLGRDAVGLNYLFHIYNRHDFIITMNSNIASDNISLLTDEDKIMIRCMTIRKNNYLANKMNKIEMIKYKDYNVAFLFADEFTSELGNHICETDNNVDFALIVSVEYGTASLRSTKDDVDVSMIAKEFGGGGHKHAAGYRLKNNVTKYIKDNLFAK